MPGSLTVSALLVLDNSQTCLVNPMVGRQPSSRSVDAVLVGDVVVVAVLLNHGAGGKLAVGERNNA